MRGGWPVRSVLGKRYPDANGPVTPPTLPQHSLSFWGSDARRKVENVRMLSSPWCDLQAEAHRPSGLFMAACVVCACAGVVCMCACVHAFQQSRGMGTGMIDIRCCSGAPDAGRQLFSPQVCFCSSMSDKARHLQMVLLALKSTSCLLHTRALFECTRDERGASAP